MKSEVCFSSVQEALERINGVAHRTPVMTSRILNQITGREVYMKCENFQRGGAFKFRGAYNAICQLSKEEKERGVVAFSSGNHAQAVALAAKELGIYAVNCIPKDSPSIKKEAVKEYGGEVIFFDRFKEDREAIARELSDEKGLVVIPPFDDPRIVAGAGTVALELLQEVGTLDAIVVAVGGGGLISGSSIAAHGFDAKIQMIGVEPEGAHDTLLSLKAGKRIAIAPSNTIADGLRATVPGELTFPIIRKHVENIITVTDDEIKQAMLFAMTRLKIVLEPSGAVSLAALLSGRLPLKYQRIGIILSGGNVDPQMMVL